MGNGRISAKQAEILEYIKKYSEIYKKLFYCEPLKSVLKENLKHEHEVEA